MSKKVEEVNEPVDYAAEQSATWRDVVREGIDAANRIAWLAWSYLMIRLGVELLTAWMR